MLTWRANYAVHLVPEETQDGTDALSYDQPADTTSDGHESKVSRGQPLSLPLLLLVSSAPDPLAPRPPPYHHILAPLDATSRVPQVSPEIGAIKGRLD